MNNAVSSQAVVWVMMNDENYQLSNIPAWVTSLNPPNDNAPPVEPVEDPVELVVDDTAKPQEKATLYTREQLLAMGRIYEDERNDENLGGGNADLAGLNEVQQKTQRRSLYNQPLSTFMTNNGDDPSTAKNRIAGVMRQASLTCQTLSNFAELSKF